MSFEFKCRLTGEVKGVNGNKLQFISFDQNGVIKMVEVKVKFAEKEYLQKYLGKTVLLEPVNVYQKDYLKYYSVDDITCIKILDKK